MRKFFCLVILLTTAVLEAVAPAPLQNYCPVVFVNRSGLNASSVYFLAHGNDPNGFPCFLVPDTNGVCQFSYPTASGTPSSASSSKTLDQLPVATGTGISDPAYLIYLPINSSSRAYFSINTPVYLPTAVNPALGVLGIGDPSVTSLTDPNYYTLYQDFEFGVDTGIVDSSTRLYLNLSYVDYLCLPMQLHTYSYPSNTEIIIDSDPMFVLPAGMPTGTSRGTLFSTINTALTNAETRPDSWSALGLGFYTNPYTDSSPSSYIRILAAKNSLDLGLSNAQFQGALAPQKYFPDDYASNTTYGSSTGNSYFEDLYTSYTGNTLYAQVFPSGVPSGVIYAITSAGTNILTFTTVPADGTYYTTLDLSALSTEDLLSGSVWPFSPAIDVNYTNELSKLISALFTVGHMPFDGTTSSGSPFVNNNNGYANLTYFGNPTGFSNGPWNNVYCQVLHEQMIGQGYVPNNPTLGIGYAYDYDDLLNMSGLITGITIQDNFGNPSSDVSAYQPYIVISLEDMSGMSIPDISQDSYSYDVTVGSAANGVAVAFTYYDGTSTQTTAAALDTPTSLGTVVVDSSHPFEVKFTFDGNDYIYHINLQRQIIVPSSLTSSFSSADQKFQGGFQFAITGGTQSNPAFTITFDSTPPPWPG